METIGKRTTTSGGTDSMLLTTESGSKTFPALISPSIIDFQSDDGLLSGSTVTATSTAATTTEGGGKGTTSDENKTEILTITTTTSAGNERWLNTSGSGGGGGQGDKDSQETTTTKSSGDTNHSQVSGGKENGSLETTKEKTTATTTSDNFSKNHSDEATLSNSHINNNSNNGGEDEEGNKEHHETTTPVPNFCVEGSGEGDSSVTVVLGPLSTNGVSSCFTECLSNDSTIDGNLEEGCCDVTENGSGPISIQSSEDMKLSLVSWYSEPEESSRQDCCRTNLISRSVKSSTGATAKSPASGTKSGVCGGVASLQLDVNDKSEEKENKTPMRRPKGGGGGGSSGGSVNVKQPTNSTNQSQSQRLKMHVQLFEQSCSPAAATGTVENGGCKVAGGKKMECPRCARRSKSGTTTPAAPSRTPRRVVQSSKSTQELKKPIKSILKSDSRGSGSRSGSEKQSSTDSLGSASGINCAMTRSEGGSCCGGRTKFNFNSASFSSSSCSPDEKLSKLKRIEKYATLRLKKPRVRPLDFGGSDDAVETHCSQYNNNHKKNGVGSPGVPSDIMTKSMSFLEKSTRATDGSDGGSQCHSNSTLRRQGSLRIRKPSPLWEPSSTRTSALRMQKMQEAKNKTTHNHHSGSNHSGSGESIHIQAAHHSSSHLCNGLNSTNNGHTTVTNNNSNSSHSAPSNNGCHCTNLRRQPQQQQTNTKSEKQPPGAKIFSKLSSAVGQTASSAMKRVRQERGIQTDPMTIASSSSPTDSQSPLCPIRISPVPIFDDQETDEAEQIKNMEILAQRYRNTALRFQHEFEKSEEKNRQLLKQLQETQSETSEMIDFLQAEKSTLAESLIEVENDGKKWKEQMDSVKKDSQTRCSTLVRLSEQHKQEALKAQALLNRLEVQSNAIINTKSAEICDAAVAIQQTRQRVVALIEKLLKTYKVPHELLVSAADSPTVSAPLLPLVSALMNVFPLNQTSSPVSKESHKNIQHEVSASITTAAQSNDTTTSSPSTTVVTTVTVNNVASITNAMKLPPSSPVIATTDTNNSTSVPSPNLGNDDSLQNLNQAILDREAAERLDDIDIISRVTAGLESIHDGDHLSISMEVDKLNRILSKLLTVIRVIVIQCDKKVCGVTSNILQCLRSIEDEKMGAIPEMVNVQKSLEAWNDGGLTHFKDSSVIVTGPGSNGHSHNNM